MRIGITGTGAICGVGASPAAIVDAALEGRSAIAEIASFDVSGWPRRHAAEAPEYNAAKLVGDRKLLKLIRRSDVFGIRAADQAIGATSPPPRLVVRTLENKSFEPNMEALYTNYLRHEFSSGSGAQIVPETEAADLVLSGQILSVSLPTLSFTQTTTLESRAEVVVIVKLEETRTKRLVWAQTAKGASEFYVTTDLQFNRVLQNQALEQAGRFIAEDLASRFLLQLESGQLAKCAARSAPSNPDINVK